MTNSYQNFGKFQLMSLGTLRLISENLVIFN